MNPYFRLIIFLFIFGQLFLGCASGRLYNNGLMRYEKVHVGIVGAKRDEEGSRYFYVAEPLYTFGTRWTGVQYVTMGNGLMTGVNTPGVALFIIYPFQYFEQTSERQIFGIGSGDSDFRYSFLWGFLSIGRNWNVFWIRGFWWGKNDPLFRALPTDRVYREYKSFCVE